MMIVPLDPAELTDGVLGASVASVVVGAIKLFAHIFFLSSLLSVTMYPEAENLN